MKSLAPSDDGIFYLHALGSLMRSLYKDKGMQQHKVAAHLGMSTTAFSKILNGKQQITFPHAVAFAKLVGISAESLDDMAHSLSVSREYRKALQGVQAQKQLLYKGMQAIRRVSATIA
jgi:plasmid maintenance system antidote protein VapI